MAATEEPTIHAETVAEAVATELSKDEKPPGKPTKKTAASKVTKPRKPAAPRKRGSPSHPPYFEMIQDAIVTLKDRTGSSQYAITKFNEEKQKNLPPNFKKILLVQLRKLVASGKLVKVKASYKLSPGPSAPAKKKPALATKPKDTASKTSKLKKVTVPKAKPAAKKKPVSKAKPAAKTKPASKTKPAAKPEAAAVPVKPKAAPKRKEPEDKKKKPAAKSAKVSASGTPGKKKALVAAAKKTVAKKAPVKSVKPRSVKSPVKKASARRGKK